MARLTGLSRYNTARILKAKQDDYCLKAKAGKWDNLGDFPADLQHQPLVDILRGKTKVNTNHVGDE